MKKVLIGSICFILLISIFFFGCTKTTDPNKVKATIENSTWTMEFKVYKGDSLIGTISAGESATYEIDKGTCLTIKKYNMGIYDSSVVECFDTDRTVTIS